MRQSRTQWLANFFKPTFGPRVKRHKVAAEKKAPSKWRYSGKRIVAFTKSEARSELKKLLGPLPHGAIIVRCP